MHENKLFNNISKFKFLILPQHIGIQNCKAKILCLKDEIQFLYIKIQNLNMKLYKIHSVQQIFVISCGVCVCIYVYTHTHTHTHTHTIIAMGVSYQRIVIDNRWLLLKYLVCAVLILCDLCITIITTFCSLVGENL